MSKGLIGIIANDAARFSEFAACVTHLQAPDGWELEWVIGGDWCGARNSLVKLTLDGGYSHLWFMDDDHSFAPDLLLRLLAHEQPLVVPVCLTRTFPFVPVDYVEGPAEIAHLGHQPIDLAGVPGEGLIPLVAGGCAGMLISREVLEAVPQPWFEYSDRSEDVIFCEKARAAGFTLYCDLATRLGHITTAVVTPWHDAENGWTTGLTIGKDMRLLVPRAHQLVEQVPPEEPTPEPPPAPAAERVEIWQVEEDGRVRWYWRALNEDGEIIVRDSSHSEENVYNAALAAFPGVEVFQVQREMDDSRDPPRYPHGNPPSPRLWNQS